MSVEEYVSEGHYSLPLARFCHLEDVQATHTNKGSAVTLDLLRIQSFLSLSDLSDSLLIKNITQGCIVSGKLWPLLFDTSPSLSPPPLPSSLSLTPLLSPPLSHFRSTPFFHQLKGDPSLLLSLSDDQRRSFMVGIRDLWLASFFCFKKYYANKIKKNGDEKNNDNEKKNNGDDNDGDNSNEEVEDTKMREGDRVLLSHLLEIVKDEHFPSAEISNLSFSLSPTQNRQTMRFMEKLEEAEMDPELMECAAQIIIGERGEKGEKANREKSGVFYIVWVDARDLSYHNFECILPLDRILHFPDSLSPEPLRLIMSDIKKLNMDMQVFTGKMEGQDVDLLLKLDQLNLYQQPANSLSRGGERFIFLSNSVSCGLNKSLEDSGMLYLLRDPENFVKVNSVFRCNRFSPGDNKFKLHMDTPYYDPSLSHISKYTLLIYLSGGEGKPALRIGGGDDGKKGGMVEINKINSLEWVIFDQQYEHEGNAFVDTEKIFLRTELIFKMTKLEKVPEIASLFSSAIYFTLEGTFQPSLSLYSHELYERVNRAHWGIEPSPSLFPSPPLLLQKCWNQKLHFATNGYDYYFPYVKERDGESPASSIKVFALLAVLDHFNCSMEIENDHGSNTVFRKECKTSVIPPPEDKEKGQRKWVIEYLWRIIEIGLRNHQMKYEDILKPIWKEEKREYTKEYDDIVEGLANEIDTICCASHYHDNFQGNKCGEVVSEYVSAVNYAKKRIMNSPLIMLNNEIRVDEENILVEDDKIYINSQSNNSEDEKGTSRRINFASCWADDDPSSYIGVDKSVKVPKLLLPPIPFSPIILEGGQLGIHLMLDFFHNSWSLPRVNIQHSVHLPIIDNDGRGTWEESDSESIIDNDGRGIWEESGSDSEI